MGTGAWRGSCNPILGILYSSGSGFTRTLGMYVRVLSFETALCCWTRAAAETKLLFPTPLTRERYVTRGGAPSPFQRGDGLERRGECSGFSPCRVPGVPCEWCRLPARGSLWGALPGRQGSGGRGGACKWLRSARHGERVHAGRERPPCSPCSNPVLTPDCTHAEDDAAQQGRRISDRALS